MTCNIFSCYCHSDQKLSLDVECWRIVSSSDLVKSIHHLWNKYYSPFNIHHSPDVGRWRTISTFHRAKANGMTFHFGILSRLTTRAEKLQSLQIYSLRSVFVIVLLFVYFVILLLFYCMESSGQQEQKLSVLFFLLHQNNIKNVLLISACWPASCGWGSWLPKRIRLYSGCQCWKERWL